MDGTQVEAGRGDVRRRLARDLPWLLAATSWVLAWPLFAHGSRFFGYDAHAYWEAWRGAVYEGRPEGTDAFLYSPAFAHAIWPIAQLPWAAFYVVWCALLLAAFWHLLSPLGWRTALPLTIACLPEVVLGNVFAIFALVAAYGLRYPALWAFPALTKIAPALGMVWFLVRGEWRKLATAVLATLAIAGVSFLVSPSLWADWFHLVTSNAGGSTGNGGRVPVLVRIPVALVLVVWGARTDRRWVLPAGMIIATPVWGLAMLTVLAALPRLVQQETAQRPDVGRPV